MTHCIGYVLASARSHQVCWGDWDMHDMLLKSLSAHKLFTGSSLGRVKARQDRNNRSADHKLQVS